VIYSVVPEQSTYFVDEHETVSSMNQVQAMQRLGVTSLRGRQQDAISALISGSDVLYLFPTGTGKTFVYECSALMSPGVTIVVSPLLGLLQQQSSKLAARGVGVLESWDGKVWCRGTGNVKVVYTTPEQLAEHSSLRRHLAVHDLCVDRLVVDEAHVLVQWETFRYATLTTHFPSTRPFSGRFAVQRVAQANVHNSSKFTRSSDDSIRGVHGNC
jgi:superfamily II DNA helicase RecQ